MEVLGDAPPAPTAAPVAPAPRGEEWHGAPDRSLGAGTAHSTKAPPHLHIGAIEIRAVQPPAPAPPRRAAAAAPAAAGRAPAPAPAPIARGYVSRFGLKQA